jgi:hypothetical protein
MVIYLLAFITIANFIYNVIDAKEKRMLPVGRRRRRNDELEDRVTKLENELRALAQTDDSSFEPIQKQKNLLLG